MAKLTLTPYGRVVAKYCTFPFTWLAIPAKASSIGSAIAEGLSQAEVRERCHIRRLPRGFYDEAKAVLTSQEEPHHD